LRPALAEMGPRNNTALIGEFPSLCRQQILMTCKTRPRHRLARFVVYATLAFASFLVGAWFARFVVWQVAGLNEYDPMTQKIARAEEKMPVDALFIGPSHIDGGIDASLFDKEMALHARPMELWVDLTTSDGKIFVYVGQLEYANDRHVFTAAGEQVIFGGIEVAQRPENGPGQMKADHFTHSVGRQLLFPSFAPR
jgi:hypothetical protein